MIYYPLPRMTGVTLFMATVALERQGASVEHVVGREPMACFFSMADNHPVVSGT